MRMYQGALLAVSLIIVSVELQTSCSFAQPSFDWAGQMSGTITGSSVYATSIAVDASGNSYTTGYFRKTVDFDPGAGIYNLSTWPFSTQAVFVSKLNAAGNFVWAKQMGGANGNGIWEGKSIALDDSGNVYTTGYFEISGDFDPGAGNYPLTSAGGNDIFVCKLDSAGNFKWARRMGGTDSDAGASIAIDDSGNVYTTGSFNGTANFNPGGTYNLPSAGFNDIFVSKLDRAGNFKWAKAMGGTDNESGFSIALGSGNVYITGYFEGTADFDPGVSGTSRTSSGMADIFVSKLDTAGNFKWIKAMGGINTDIGMSIAVDNSGNVYTTGRFLDNVDFDPGTGSFPLSAAGGITDDIFVSKLDSAGNFVWAKRMGGTATDWGYSIAVDNSSNVYTTGYFTGTVDFNPGTGEDTLVGTGGTNDIFVSELDSAGNFVCAGNMGGTSGDGGYGIAVDFCNNIYITGYFGGTADFNPGEGKDTLVSTGSASSFVNKLAPGTCTNKLPQAVITPSGPTTFYSCQSVVLDAGSGFLSYQWLPAGTTTQSITPTVTDNYSVVVSNVCGSSTSPGVIVTVNPQPTIALTQNATVCYGDSIVLSTYIIPDGFYSLQWSPAAGLNATIGGEVKASPGTGITTYTLTGANGAGCYNVQTVSIETRPLPPVTGSSGVELCMGNSTLLTAVGAASYNWSPATYLSSATNSTVTFSQAPAGIQSYTITGYDGTLLNCSNTHTLTVTVHDLPIVNAGTDQFICLDGTATLNATGTGGDYTWSPGAYFASNTGNAVTAVVPAVAGSYTCNVSLTDLKNCSASDAVIVTVVTALIANAGPDVSVLCGSSTTLSGSGGLTFAWSPAMGLSSTNSSSTAFDLLAPGIYSYSLVVASGIGCVSAPDEVIITVDSIQANAGQDVSICSGSVATFSGTGGNLFSWTPGAGLSDTTAGSVTFNQTEPGMYVYALTVSNGTGCTSRPDEIIVTVIAIPTVSAGPDVTIRPDQGDTLHAAGNAQSYSWNPNACSDCLDPAVFPSDTTQYILIASNAFCSAADTVTAYYVLYPCDIYVPNAFSPNSDGENDRIKVYSHCLKADNFAFRIYDRWGTLLFESFQLDDYWNGVYESMDKSTAVLVYQLQAETINNENIIKSGNISLVR